MLELFPAAVLDTSILTSVLVGLVVVWALQEWFGWGFTGLVVPGYLASVLAIQPLTAGVMVFEAVATWLVMVALSDAVPRWWPWSPLFGRDRFFLALLASVAVRLAMEGAGFPLLAERFDVRVAAELHSMGLVIVPLLAYAIWRNGPVRAVPRVGVPLFITWAVLQHVLLARTNLSLGSFELTYEDLALDFTSSPRAYVLLLVGAWLGSVANLRYGWDFGGIIVPGLLALCWLQPERLAATLGECVVIAIALQLLLRLPWLRETNLAGGRMLVLAMLVGYTLKFGLGQILGAGWPGLRLRQLFGFGYLLPSIMALRIVRSGDPFRTLVPSLFTSLAGFVGGTALAWVMALALPAQTVEERVPPPGRPAADTLLLGAWRNEGEPPVDLAAVMVEAEDAGLEALVAGGDGFGALWVRDHGQGLVISARVGTPGLPEAALAVADALDARSVHLCGPVGATCGEARRRLGLTRPLLIIEAGTDATLVGTGPVVKALDLPALTAVVGDLRVLSTDGASVLTLPPGARMSAAAAWRATSPGTWEHPARAPFRTPADAPDGTTRLVRDAIVTNALQWARSSDDDGIGTDALDVATGTATAVGARLVRDGDHAAVIADDWRMVVARHRRPVVLRVPFAEDSPGMLATALTLMQALDAAVLIVDAPPRRADAGYDAGRVAHFALLGALQSLGDQARVVTVRGMRDLQDPGADVVISLGRAVEPDRPAPDDAGWLADDLTGAGLTVAWYDGAAVRMGLRDAGNPARSASRAATGAEDHLTLWVSSSVRARARVLDSDHPRYPLLAAADLPVWTIDAADIARAAEGVPVDPGVVAAGQDLVDLGRSGDLRQLQRLARGPGGSLGIACDPLAGCRWLALLQCRDGACDGHVLGLAPAVDGVPGASASDRLLLSGLPVAVAGLPDPDGPR
ncbi:MAG: poly-gamma-glutamate biosynthesis protein PgsC/CapC [Alphaproteobacteria bacterium]|nr:poly-gamma-glutamate biosynthesis protein PgsC/CapC [Alphaproteobacteria bacterium]